ncbi:zinc finger protein without children isoform X3 [Rhodnius prolixus]
MEKTRLDVTSIYQTNLGTGQPDSELKKREEKVSAEESEKTNEADKVRSTSLENSADSVDNLLLGAEIVMEVDEVDQDEETEELPAISSGDPISDKVQQKELVEVMDVEERSPASSIETITGDHSLSEDAVLKNPNVTVCILSNSSPDKRSSSDNSTHEHPPPSPAGSTTVAIEPNGEKDVIPVSETTTETKISVNENKENDKQGRPEQLVSSSIPSTSRSSADSYSTNNSQKKLRTLKVLYPKKKVPSGDLEMVKVAPALRDCLQCAKFTTCTTKVTISGMECYLCSKECIVEQKLLHKKAVALGSVVLQAENDLRDESGSLNSRSTETCHQEGGDNGLNSKPRQCTSCSKAIRPEQHVDNDLEGGVLQWATMDFCSEECLAKYQALTGSNCQLCGSEVTPMSMGKYSVRFGYETRQFCTSTCLEEFKKGLKACSYCQRDLNSDGGDESVGFLAPVGEKGQFKDFCSPDCLEKYDTMSHNLPIQLSAHECAVCNKPKIVIVEVITAEKTVKLCSDVCFAAFKFVNDKMKISLCNMCKKYFDTSALPEQIMFYEDQPLTFCSKTCQNVQVLSKRKICPCNWCKVKKYNFDMIRKKMNNSVVYMCSLNCLALYQVSLRATIGKQKCPSATVTDGYLLKCDWCGKTEKANFHLTMSDASLRNFCSFECVDKFRGQYKVSGTGTATVTSSSLIVGATGMVSTVTTANSSATNTTRTASVDLPVIASVHSLKKFEPQVTRNQVKVLAKSGAGEYVSGQQTTVSNQPADSPSVAHSQTSAEILVRPISPVLMKNKITNVRVRRATKGTSCRPNKVSRLVQTDQDEENQKSGSEEKKAIVPIPVPIYVPTPLAMYSVPVPTLIPVPIPVPVPVFVPTSRASAKQILEDIKRIQDTFPQNPCEAELLTMAQKAAEKTSDILINGISNDIQRLSGEDNDEEENSEETKSPHFMGFEALTVMEEDSASFTPADISSPAASPADPLDSTTDGQTSPSDVAQMLGNNAIDKGDTVVCDDNTSGLNTKKRMADYSPGELGMGSVKKRKEEEKDVVSRKVLSGKLDGHMLLKYSLGVNAWKYFASHYNEDINRKMIEEGKEISVTKLLRSDLLEMRQEELNQALTLLMSEGRMPNGESYSPDTKYYLALGIQFHLLRNGRVDNIFSDAAYQSFTDQLDTEARLFQEIVASGNSIVTRVEEEHLWESRQLGVHSPYVLLSTLLYLNTKHFQLATLEEHSQLSFSQIWKDSKRGSNATAAHEGERQDGEDVELEEGRSSRSVYLKFFPQQSTLDVNPSKKRRMEQFENEEDPSRCPVRLYEFYLSRCPESVKSRNDVFYLQPERSCAPDSPVWYSCTPLPDFLLEKMLNRIKMVKEINLALVS